MPGVVGTSGAPEEMAQHGAMWCGRRFGRSPRLRPLRCATMCRHRVHGHSWQRMTMLERLFGEPVFDERPFDERTFDREEEDLKNPGGSPTPPPPL